MKNFLNMTKTQLRVFEQIAINNDLGHNPRTVHSLHKRGYIESYRQPFTDQLGTSYITRYKVPLSIHIDWCEWCEANPDEGQQ